MSNKYGPQTEEIEQLIQKARVLTQEQAKSLSDAWYDADESAWGDAWYEAKHSVERTASVQDWDNGWETAWYNARDNSRYGATDKVWDVIYDAVLALAVKDQITQERFDLLYGPWASVMEAQS